MRVADRVPAGSFDVETLLKGETLVDLTKPVASPAGEFTADCENGTLQVVTPRSEALGHPARRKPERRSSGRERQRSVLHRLRRSAGRQDSGGQPPGADSAPDRRQGRRPAAAMLGSRILMYNLGQGRRRT